MGDLRLGMMPARLMARVRGRSYWEVRYRDGRTISELQTGCCDQRDAQGKPLHRTFDWPELPRHGLVAARLVCPNGEIGVLGNPQDISDRVFQFKVAVLRAGLGHELVAHVLGLVVGTNGAAQCYAWEPEHLADDGHTVVRGRLIRFLDNVEHFAYQQVGRLAYERVGIKPD